jgi:hypothetical protein
MLWMTVDLLTFNLKYVVDDWPVGWFDGMQIRKKDEKEGKQYLSISKVSKNWSKK